MIQKKIKTIYLESMKALVWDATIYDFHPAVQHRLLDDIRIIGAEMSIYGGSDGGATWQDGELHTHGELSLVGTRGQHGSILDVGAIMSYDVEAGGLSFSGNCNNWGSIMFPDGHGIDLDEGDYLYLHLGCYCGAMTAGNHGHGAHCIVYYVER